LTEEGVYSLSPQATKVIQDLKKPLKIVWFKGIGIPNEQETMDLVELMRATNKDLVRIESVDPRTQPHLVDTYGMKRGNMIYLAYGEGADQGVSRINESSEEALVNAVLKLTRGDAKKIYYVVGHGEPELKSDSQDGVKQLVDALGDERLTIEGLVLPQVESVPNDAAAVILCSPDKDLSQKEQDALKSYVDGGGKLMLFADPRRARSVRALSAQFGISVGEDIVVDQVQRLFAGPALGVQPIVRDYGQHPITANFSEQTIVVFSQASSVTAPQQGPPGTPSQITVIAKTGDTAWAEKDLAALFDAAEPSADKGSEDIGGPVGLAAVYEKKLDSKEQTKEGEPQFEKTARVVVFGDSDWIKNANLMVYAHRDFILNTVNWMVGESGGVTIRPRSIRKPELTPITSDTYLNILSASFIIPEIIFILGLLIWWRRRTAVMA
jgi:ABC-type uncharacterized transport system involved in gliding motility auxiliary subunit